jgi:hypothetical protein
MSLGLVGGIPIVMFRQLFEKAVLMSLRQVLKVMESPMRMRFISSFSEKARPKQGEYLRFVYSVKVVVLDLHGDIILYILYST